MLLRKALWDIIFIYIILFLYWFYSIMSEGKMEIEIKVEKVEE